MQHTLETVRNSWAESTEARHRHSSSEWHRFYAAELLLYFPPSPCRVLELGCGNGDLYEYIRPRCATYRGVDLSPAMVGRFHERWPEVELNCCDAASLPGIQGEFDFIFSNGMLQYFDVQMLRQNLRRVRELLSDRGTYLIANVPDKHLRSYYYAGALRSDSAASWKGLARSWIRFLLLGRDDGIGAWYSRLQVACEARAAGFACQTYSSASYEYRFHALLKMHAPGATGGANGNGKPRTHRLPLQVSHR